MEKDNGNIQYMDIHLAAFLQLRGIEPVLQKQAGRVVFTFPNTAQATSLIREYNANPAGIRLLDYVQHLRKLRSRMLTMRD